MWIANYCGMKATFDIRGILLAFILFVGYVFITIVADKLKRYRFLRIPSIVVFNIIFALVIAKYNMSIAIDTIVIAFLWTVFILSIALPNYKSTTRNTSTSLIEASVLFILLLLIGEIALIGPARYERNVIEYPEVETMLYCLDEEEYVSEDMLLEGHIIDSSSITYNKKVKTAFTIKTSVIDGAKDYIRKTVTTYYIEDQNVEPAISSVSRVEIEYILYIGEDKS